MMKIRPVQAKEPFRRISQQRVQSAECHWRVAIGRKCFRRKRLRGMIGQQNGRSSYVTGWQPSDAASARKRKF
jgi:ribosomal protein L32E